VDSRVELPQTVVVFGGSSEIARAITKKLCMARAHTVILAGRNQTLLDQAAREAEEYGASKTDTVLFDAEEPSRAASTVEEAFAKAGDRVDLVVVAVGTVGDQSNDENHAEGSARMITVNETWPVAALAEVRRRLVDQGNGRILVLSSTAAVRVRRVSYLYSVSVSPSRSKGPGCDFSCCVRPRCARECRSISRPLPLRPVSTKSPTTPFAVWPVLTS
jgi:decaprenylphospho-beta-D-erythro-pentofuranosid-2-ulose 2-reductase